MRNSPSMWDRSVPFQLLAGEAVNWLFERERERKGSKEVHIDVCVLAAVIPIPERETKILLFVCSAKREVSRS